MPEPVSGPPSPKRPGAGTWLGIAGALIIALAWVQSTSTTTSPVSAAPASSQQADKLQTPASQADASDFSPSDGTEATPGSDDDQYASGDDDASDTDDTVCDDDSYLSSDGDCVHRPVAATTAPVGASAQCNDGTYSFSEHRRGTCSHHGGVVEWL